MFTMSVLAPKYRKVSCEYRRGQYAAWSHWIAWVSLLSGARCTDPGVTTYFGLKALLAEGWLLSGLHGISTWSSEDLYLSNAEFSDIATRYLDILDCASNLLAGVSIANGRQVLARHGFRLSGMSLPGNAWLEQHDALQRHLIGSIKPEVYGLFAACIPQGHRSWFHPMPLWKWQGHGARHAHSLAVGYNQFPKSLLEPVSPLFQFGFGLQSLAGSYKSAFDCLNLYNWRIFQKRWFWQNKSHVLLGQSSPTILTKVQHFFFGGISFAQKNVFRKVPIRTGPGPWGDSQDYLTREYDSQELRAAGRSSRSD